MLKDGDLVVTRDEGYFAIVTDASQRVVFMCNGLAQVVDEAEWDQLIPLPLRVLFNSFGEPVIPTRERGGAVANFHEVFGEKRLMGLVAATQSDVEVADDAIDLEASLLPDTATMAVIDCKRELGLDPFAATPEGLGLRNAPVERWREAVEKHRENRPEMKIHNQLLNVGKGVEEPTQLVPCFVRTTDGQPLSDEQARALTEHINREHGHPTTRPTGVVTLVIRADALSTKEWRYLVEQAACAFCTDADGDHSVLKDRYGGELFTGLPPNEDDASLCAGVLANIAALVETLPKPEVEA